MDLCLRIVLSFYVVYISVADGFENDSDILFEEVKQYIVKIVSMMTAKHSTDIHVLMDKIDSQERKINILESEKEMYTSAIQDVEKKILTVKNEMKTQSCECHKKPDEPKEDDKTSTKDPSEQGQNVNQVIEQESPIHYQRRIRSANLGVYVAFFATLTPSLYHLGKDQDIVFDHIVTNIGIAYNENDGNFIAPVTGTYAFSVTLHQGANEASHTGGTRGHVVVNNGTVVAKLRLFQEQSSQTIIVNLKVGDKVSIQNTVTDRALSGDQYSTFCGFLLYEDIFGYPAVG